jgi:uncharacterized protein YecE (DUF72 family)
VAADPPGIHIGTSGWSYDAWRGAFYPDGLAAADRLPWYAGRFASVEIDSTFYRQPDADTVAHWRDTVPEGFIFSVKASRYITHMKKLKDPDVTLPPFLDRIAGLGDRLGPVLFQLPPHWAFDPDRLAGFLARLGPGRRCAFEFRDPSWFDARSLALLGRHGAALCIYDLAGWQSPVEVTADFVYLRLHGPDGPYQGSYDDRALAGWAGRIERWAGDGRAVYCYFDNDQCGYAAANAQRLRRMLAPA